MKTATTTASEMESALGPRGQLVVTTSNRRDVRKWLNAQGFPALFSGGLSMRELGLAYNDTSGRSLNNLRRKLEEAGRDAGEGDTAGATVDANTAFGQSQGEAGQSSLTGEDAQRAEEAAMAATRRNAEKSGDDDLAAAARKFAEIIARQGGQTPVNKSEVQDIVRESMRGFEDKIKDLTTTRIEVKLPDAQETQVLEGHHHPKFATLLKAAASRQVDGFRPNILLSGPAGSGKTYSCKTVIKTLELEYFFNGALSMAHEVLGYQDAHGTYHETGFFKGYTRKAGYIFDEVDGSDNSPLLALNAALANGSAYFPHGMFERHPDSLIVATANTWGLGATADYVGRSKLDAAFLSRFGVRIYWDYDEKLEQQICGNPDWAKKVQKARAAAKKAGIKVIICPRLSIAGAALVNNGFTFEEAADLTYLANLTEEQKRIVQG